ncbi:MAG: DUF192 domain-containing protein [Candidatus Magasanikbacteria bacterium]
MEEENKRAIDKKYIIGFAIFFLLFIGVRLWQLKYETIILQVEDVVVEVQVVNTIYQAEKGLGGRKSIGRYDGMFFPFSFPGKHAIVMRDMQFSIDIIWVHQGKIVDIAPNVPTEPGVPEHGLRRYSPRMDATAVIEFPAGWVDRNGVKIGDSVKRPGNE